MNDNLKNEIKEELKEDLKKEIENELKCELSRSLKDNLENRDKKILDIIFNSFLKSNISNIGVILAMLISYSHNEIIGKIIFHGILGWFYVFYCFFTNNLF